MATVTLARDTEIGGAVEVFFDYTCPFTYRAQGWLDGLADVEVMWRPFSLLEANYRGDGPSVWRRPDRADDISLLLFAGHELVRARGGDEARYRRAVFHAWHGTHARLDLDAVARFAAEAGVAADEQAVRAHFLDAEAEHAAGAKLGVFGTPTLVYPDRAVAFVKLDTIPAPERARPLWQATRELALHTGELREWQRISPEEGAR
ncbi:DsbA family protein [Pseudonocardia nigra]|uniref:DsbA family protein n=1 Tax=Pseudonocardia nigra TaxID=1921578 RepID=UPI001C6007C6|nr:DsbA family protein [Pseudonocardia nigra]